MDMDINVRRLVWYQEFTICCSSCLERTKRHYFHRRSLPHYIPRLAGTYCSLPIRMAVIGRKARTEAEHRFVGEVRRFVGMVLRRRVDEVVRLSQGCDIRAPLRQQLLNVCSTRCEQWATSTSAISSWQEVRSLEVLQILLATGLYHLVVYFHYPTNRCRSRKSTKTLSFPSKVQ